MYNDAIWCTQHFISIYSYRRMWIKTFIILYFNYILLLSSVLCQTVAVVANWQLAKRLVSETTGYRPSFIFWTKSAICHKYCTKYCVCIIMSIGCCLCMNVHVVVYHKYFNKINKIFNPRWQVIQRANA